MPSHGTHWEHQCVGNLYTRACIRKTIRFFSLNSRFTVSYSIPLKAVKKFPGNARKFCRDDPSPLLLQMRFKPCQPWRSATRKKRRNGHWKNPTDFGGGEGGSHTKRPFSFASFFFSWAIIAWNQFRMKKSFFNFEEDIGRIAFLATLPATAAPSVIESSKNVSGPS